MKYYLQFKATYLLQAVQQFRFVPICRAGGVALAYFVFIVIHVRCI